MGSVGNKKPFSNFLAGNINFIKNFLCRSPDCQFIHQIASNPETPSEVIITLNDQGQRLDIDNPDLNQLSPDDQKKQTQLLMTNTETDYTNQVSGENDDWRTPLPSEVRTYELTGFLPMSDKHFTWKELFDIKIEFYFDGWAIFLREKNCFPRSIVIFRSYEKNSYSIKSFEVNLKDYIKEEFKELYFVYNIENKDILLTELKEIIYGKDLVKNNSKTYKNVFLK